MSDRNIDLEIRAKALLGDAQRQIGQFLREIETGANRAEKESSFLGRTLSTTVGTLAGFVSAQAIMSGLSSAFSFAKEAVFGMNTTLETSTLQFKTLMGDAGKAEAHVRSLFEFAKKTPFETGPIIQASRLLQTFGGDALNSAKNLQLIGDAAAGTTTPINEVAFWIGRAYSMIQGGKPFGEAAMRLQELAILSPQARDAMEKLQKSGAEATVVWQVLQGELGKFTGAMELQAGTWSGVTSTFKDTINILLADTFKPFFEIVRDGLGLINQAMGSEGVQATMDALRDSVKGTFGADSQATVRALAQSLIGFAQTSLIVTEGVYRAFRTMADAVTLDLKSMVGAVMSTMKGSLDAMQTVLLAASRIDPTGNAEKYLKLLVAARIAADQATHGNDAFVTSIDGVQKVLDSVRANLDAATTATNTTATAVKGSAIPAMQSLTATTKEAGASISQMAKYTADLQEKIQERALAQLNADGLQWIETAKKAYRAHLDIDSAMTAGQITIKGTAVDIIYMQRELRNLETIGKQGIGNLVTAFEGLAVHPPKLKGLFGNLVDGFKGGLDSIWKGMSGDKGFPGLMNNLGSSIVNGFGDILSGGLTSVINMGISLAMEGAKKLAGVVSNLFKSEETKKVNSPRDSFFNQFIDKGFGSTAFEAIANAFTSVGGGDVAERMIQTLYDADTDAKWKQAQSQVADFFTNRGLQVQRFHQGGTVPGFGEVNARLLGGEGVLNRRAMLAIGGPEGLNRMNAGVNPQGEAMLTEMRAMVRSVEMSMRDLRDLPRAIQRSVRDGVLQAV